MNPTQRCDEIIRLIDEALRTEGRTEPVTRQDRRPDTWLDRRFVLVRPENRP